MANADMAPSKRPAEAEERLHAGDPAGALKALQDVVRAQPADAKLRVFLFQLLCVLGEWERALTQLSVIGDLDKSALPMVQTYREAIRCERLREEVCAGLKTPLLFGEPEAWLALSIESLLREGRGEAAEARSLRAKALEEAPATPGTLNGSAFQWIADGDTRFGPVLEALANGRYYWIPYARLARIELEAPADLRDAVWMPAQLEFANGGAVAALIPTRYPRSSESADPLVKLARKTEWTESAPDTWFGLGQRMLMTDGGEHALMDVREIVLNAGDSP